MLAVQFPGENPVIYNGKWKEVKFQNLPEECFFISDFTTEKTYLFQPREQSEKIDVKALHFQTDDTVFVANGRAYLNGLQFFIDGFETDGIQKAIYSRIKSVEKKQEDNIAKIFTDLAHAYKNEALVYLVSDEKFGTWMGATPEVLIAGNQEQLHSMALAGTKRDKNVDWTPKERDEHQFVVDHIQKNIEPFQPKQLKIETTKTVKAGAVYHLQTDFYFQVHPSQWNDLMLALHPTPAICGTPMEKAKAYILKQEPHERKFYTGLIGKKTPTEIAAFVNLRCMQVLENQYALYLGGGITLDSKIEDEYQETEDKSGTLMRIIGK